MNLVASIKSFFQKNKNDSEGFYTLIRSDKWSSLLGKDQIKMIEGVIEVSSLQVRDIMIPRSNMILLEDDIYRSNASNHYKFRPFSIPCYW